MTENNNTSENLVHNIFLRHILRADVAGKLRSLFGFLTASVYSFV